MLSIYFDNADQSRVLCEALGYTSKKHSQNKTDWIFFTVEYKFESRFYLLPAQNTNDAILRRLVRIKKPYVTTFLAHTIKFF